ncbi:hypothetical protein EON64_00640, partial [archaeon]
MSSCLFDNCTYFVSAAGKTEATKQCLQLLSSIASAWSGKTEAVPIEDRVLATNPILESFGNAKTARNNNSSRFGKWIQLNYKAVSVKQGTVKLVGARITQYLLEKSRVIVHASEERNYHIFYQLCANGVADLQPAANYRYLRFAKSLKVPGIDDKVAFEETQQSMAALGFTPVDTHTLFACLKAILLLGNIVFAEQSPTNNIGYKASVIGSEFLPLVHNICSLFDLSEEEMCRSLTGRTMTLRGETTRIEFDIPQAQNAVNALCKEIYGRLFSFIIYQANTSLKGDEFRSLVSMDEEERKAEGLSIGVLDIFGFEKFKLNSFEQLCINYANEKLHQYFITYVLKKEKDLYEAEGIESSFVTPIDNTDVLQLLEAKANGLFARLDDEVKLPKATDETFLKKVEADHNNKQNPNRRFIREVKMAALQFEVRHFAGQIRYDCAGFLEKNRDKLYEHLEALLASSGNARFRELMTTDWSKVDAETGRIETVSSLSKSNSTTIATRFQSQLGSLMEVLDRSQPQFIKCIKPNNAKEPLGYEEELVLTQLRYSGVLEAIQVRKSGYPTRRVHAAFWKAFWMVPPRANRASILSLKDYDKCAQVISRLQAVSPLWGDIQLGKTLVFLRSNTTKLLEQEKEKRKIVAAMFGQTHIRRKRSLVKYKEMCSARDRLHTAVLKGKQNKRSNIAIIPEITLAIEISKEHNLPIKWIQDAQFLLERLIRIKTCLDELSGFANDKSQGQQDDVVQEYQKLKHLLSTAKELDIESPILTTVSNRLVLLQDRAECLLKLRKAMEEGDEFAIQESIQEVQRLTSSHGKFCEQDASIASSRLALIQKDHVNADKLVAASKECQNGFQDALVSRAVSRPDIIQYFTECDRVITQHKVVWDDSPPHSSRIGLLLKLFYELNQLHCFWQTESWSETIRIVQSITASTMQQIKSIEKRYLDAHNYFALACTLVTKDIDIVQHDIHHNVLLPKVLSSLQSSSILRMQGADERLNDCSDVLPALMLELRSYSWLGRRCDGLLVCLEKLQELRESFLDSQWEKVLLHTEDKIQTEKRTGDRNTWLHAIKELSLLNEDVLEELELSFAFEGATYRTVEAIAELEGDFASVQKELYRQIYDIRNVAIGRVIAKSLVQAINLSVLFDRCDNLEYLNLPGVHACITATLRHCLSLQSLFDDDKRLSEANKAFISIVQAVLDAWQLAINNSHKNVLDTWNQRLFDSLNSTSEEVKAEYGQAVEVLRVYTSVTVYLCFQSVCIPAFSTEICDHPYDFAHSMPAAMEGSVSSSSDLARFKKLIENEERMNERLVCSASLENSEIIVGLISLSKVLLAVRETLSRNLENIKQKEEASDLLDQLKALRINYADVLDDSILSSVAREIETMELALRIQGCVQEINSAVTCEINGANLYLLTAPAGGAAPSKGRAKRPTSVGSTALMMSPVMTSPAVTRPKSLSFHDTNPSLPTLEDILYEDGFVLNETVLATNMLNEVLEQSHELLGILEEEENLVAVNYLQEYITALEQVRDIRTSIHEEDWARAHTLYSQLIQSEAVNKMGAIKAEVQANESILNNYAVIGACHQALSKGLPVGPIGQVDYKSLALTLLEDAINMCQTIGCTSDRAKALFNAVLVITDLRKAQKVGDWTEIRQVLARAEKQKIAEGLASFCQAEISRASLERDNYEATQLLKSAVVNEEMFSKEGKLDVEQISVKELSSVMGKVFSIPEDLRGSVLKSLHMLSDSLLKTRKCAMQGQWQVVESLLPVLKENIENFQNELENKDKQPLGRKTLSFRTSSVRNHSMMPSANSPKDKQKSVLAPDAPGIRSAVWEEFAELTQSVKREIKAIEHHFGVIELEKELNVSLTQHGAQLNESGTIDRDAIKIDKLQEVLDLAASMDMSNLSLPKHLKVLRKVGMLILDIRTAIVKDQWDAMSSLLEETLSGEISIWPEYSKVEIQAVRREVENRWIISNLSSALATGRLEGELGGAEINKVTYHHLLSYVETAKSLNPRTEVSLSLIRTVEVMYTLREVLVKAHTHEENVNWTHVRKIAKEMLEQINTQYLHPMILPEVKLALDTAENEIICEMLIKALRTGGPGGEPGALILSTVATKELEKVYSIAVRSSIKTALAKSLLTTCRIVQKLREALVRAEIAADPFSVVAQEAWRTVEALLAEVPALPEVSSAGMYPAQMSQEERVLRTSWGICVNEMHLIRRHFSVEMLRRSLVQSCTHASHVYYERNSYKLTNELVEETIHDEELPILATEIEEILQQAEALDFECIYLDKYKSCASTLRLLRKTLTEKKFDELRSFVANVDLRQNVAVLPEAKQEFAWILCEYHNSAAITLVKEALKAVCEEDSTTSDEQSMKVIKAENFTSKTKRLEAALASVGQLKVTSELAKQWLECCENMFSLRRNLELRQHTPVNRALRWFRNNAKISPTYVKVEAQRAFIIYQNDLLAQELTVAISEGKGLGKIGEVNTDHIQTERLEALIKQANDVHPIFPETQELVKAGKIALQIRSGLKYRDMLALQDLIDALAEQEGEFNLLIIDEIATARAEVDNDVAVQALVQALKSFEDVESNAFDISFLQETPYASGGPLGGRDGSTSKPGKKSAGYSILESMAERRYSFANKHNANIDPDTIDVTVLDKGLRVALDHGVYSTRAIRLYRTVQLVKELRLSMKAADWPKVQEVLDDSQYEATVGDKYDLLASREILAVRSQLEIRAAIVDLSKALRQGWAKCNQGIVDTSQMDNEVLSNAIDCADRCIMELSIQISSSDKATLTLEQRKVILDASPIHKKVQLLMESAKQVLRIREVLTVGDMELAGSLADEALKQTLHYSVVEELRLYAKEINIALGAMNMAETLRLQANKGQLAPLSNAIGEAVKLEAQHSNDLGIVRVLDCAEQKYQKLLLMRKELVRGAEQIYSVAELNALIEQAKTLNYSDSELQTCVEKASKLTRFDALLKDFHDIWTSAANDKVLIAKVLTEADALSLQQHPEAIKLRLLNRVTPQTLRGYKVHEAFAKGDIYAVCTETIKLKRAYLDIPLSQQRYKLDCFPRLRRPEEFAQRMTVVSHEMKDTMLVHSDQPLPTSLTALPPSLASVAVLIFTDCVRGVEKHIYTSPQLAVRKLFEVGCRCVSLRDEILLQLVKQTRYPSSSTSPPANPSTPLS